MQGGKCKQVWLENKCDVIDEQTIDASCFEITPVYVAEYEHPQLAALEPIPIAPDVLQKFIDGSHIDYEDDNRAPLNQKKRNAEGQHPKEEDIIMQ